MVFKAEGTFVYDSRKIREKGEEQLRTTYLNFVM